MPNYLPARGSTEQARALRAEVAGGVLLVLGISLAYGVQPARMGLFVAGIGLLLDVTALAVSWYGRSKIKASAVSPPSVVKLNQRKF